MKPRLALLLKAAAMVLSVVASAVVFAPAAWLAQYLEDHGALRLIDPQGTLWNGSAMVAFSNGRGAHLVPGRIQWDLEFWPLLAGRGVLHLRVPYFDAAISMRAEAGNLRITAGSAVAPAAVLAGLGMPFNTLRPGGQLRVQWSELQAAPGRLDGEIEIDWLRAQSALSQVAPLGDFRLRIQGVEGKAHLLLSTLQGPLLLSGEGVVDDRRVRFEGVATAEQAMRPALNTLIGVLGPRDGDKVLLRVDG